MTGRAPFTVVSIRRTRMPPHRSLNGVLRNLRVQSPRPQDGESLSRGKLRRQAEPIRAIWRLIRGVHADREYLDLLGLPRLETNTSAGITYAKNADPEPLDGTHFGYKVASVDVELDGFPTTVLDL
jgi:hypothetical protein